MNVASVGPMGFKDVLGYNMRCFSAGGTGILAGVTNNKHRG